ncbi:hypothetical protein E9993_17400 [Labilibacter sediminis]|nr:hypothetical protein E9993_17400 [Labilibacter sediminis]
MTLKERLEFCSICEKREVNLKTGLACSITNEKPDFEDKCQSFIKDEQEADRRLELSLRAAGNARTQDGSAKPSRNKLYGLVVLILGLVVFLLSMIIGILMIVTGISFIIKGFQQDKVLKKNKLFNAKLSN